MKKITVKNHHGEDVTAQVGGYISFKYDYEQTRKVLAIRNGFRGPQVQVEYAMYDEQRINGMWFDLEDCWND